MKDIMIDIETLGTTYGCAVLSIGAVRFDRNTGEIGDKFYASMGQQAQKYGHASQATLDWWDQQSPEAKEAAFSGTEDPVTVANTLASGIDKNDLVWGNGSIFDITILESWFSSVNVAVPWKFWNVRDVRTIVDLSPLNVKDFIREGVHHNALDDAIHQAKYVSAMIQSLRA
ncbi:3'-5' exonuclease [Yersinia rohdei]|uniref:3'-5' exonuclease n=1 Tax=Yersinia rohdei TaxID=29485 RepID=UPI0025AA6A2E|nr:3'-5' exonuclease [Yersinia rohdei]MDN0096225.1 3'-5' exonuclease [Yersinia rohdei]